jgi:hypothetical protein
MKLTPEQIERFERDGYLFFPGLFSAEEMAVLKAEVPSIYAQHAGSCLELLQQNGLWFKQQAHQILDFLQFVTYKAR